MAQDIFLTAGSGSYVVLPTVTSLTVECWGGGGGGGGNTTTADGGGGGGGGAYSSKTFDVTPGQTFTYYVAQSGSGVAGANGTSGQSSWFSSSLFQLAEGGISGSTPVAGNGGLPGRGGLNTNSIGDITFSGGTGGTGRNNNTGTGGGGGSSAGSAANGTNGSTGGATGGAGGTAPLDGGNGGNGGNAGQNGSPGVQPGGGGGGSGDTGTRTGGNGAVGKIIVNYVQGGTMFISWIG